MSRGVNRFIQLSLYFLLILVSVYLVITFVGQRVSVIGVSMEPTLTEDDHLLVDKLSYRFNEPERFDIVVTYYSETDISKKIKRIVGLPGETIKFTSTSSSDPKNGDLYVKVNDEFTLIEQPIGNDYKVEPVNYPKNEIVLGENEFYVLGDNRNNSQDSRANGPIKKEWIVGKVVALCGYCSIEKIDGINEPIEIDYYWPRWF